MVVRALVEEGVWTMTTPAWTPDADTIVST
jgi:hypothetical protein